MLFVFPIPYLFANSTKYKTMPIDVDYKIFDKKSDCDLEIYLRPCHCVIYVSICTYTYILYIYITINIYYHMINI